MSQSPIDDFSERNLMRYRQGWKALNRLLHEDRSFSGNERNCAFLNTRGEDGNQRFADISAISGFDFADDGRALALCDWDFDGDLDIWVTNRSAPRIRLLRNNSSRKNHFLAIKLQGNGERTNRDAVGARVQVVLEGNERPLVKTLSAGDGFLSQSSGWLHFGLGSAQGVQKVLVRWPGGKVASYQNFEIDHRYVIDQKTNLITKWTAPKNRKTLIPTEQQPLKSSSVARTVLPARRLLPTLKTDKSAEPLNFKITRPTVISIWSATCTSCVKELHEYTEHADRLRKAGLDVIAINLDNLEGDSEAAERVLANTKFPFTTASGTIELVRSLDVLKRAIFDRWQTLAVPSSFLVDERGFVGVVYQGPVSIDRLLEDMRLLDVPTDQLRQYSSPFAGKWIMPPPTADPLQVTSRFVDEAMVMHGMDYLERHARILESSPSDIESHDPGDLYYVLAILLKDQEQVDDSVAAFRKAIEYRPDDFRFRTDFASLLAKQGKLKQAAKQLQEGLRINPGDVSVHRRLAFVRMAEGNTLAAIKRFKTVLKAQPTDVACWYNLANAYRANGQMKEAVQMYRRTLKIQPKMALAANNLAWILATHPENEMRDGTQAVKWAKRVCEQTKFTHPGFLDTLACAYAEQGDFENAVKVVTRAIKIYEQNGKDTEADNMKARLKLFQQRQPHRSAS